MNAITIRSVTASDVASSGHRLPNLLVDHWRPDGNRRSLAAAIDGQVVGHARGADNPFHPRSRVLTVEVLADYRRQGIGTALVAAQRDVSDRPLELKIYTSMTAERALARRFGGIAVQAIPPWRYAMTSGLRAWAREHSGPVEPAVGSDGPELLKLEVRHYLQQHAAWSPADATALTAEFADDFVPGSPSAYDPRLSTILRRGRRIVAAALVWPYASGPHLNGNEVSLICEGHGSLSGRRDMEQCLAGVINRCADDAVLLIDSHRTEKVESAMLDDLPGPEPSEDDEWMVIVALPVPGGPAPIAMPAGLVPSEARWIEDEFIQQR